MKELFLVFNHNGIQYNYLTNFNMNGEFHGVCIFMWKEHKKKEPKFGTYQCLADFDYEGDTHS